MSARADLTYRVYPARSVAQEQPRLKVTAPIPGQHSSDSCGKLFLLWERITLGLADNFLANDLTIYLTVRNEVQTGP